MSRDRKNFSPYVAGRECWAEIDGYRMRYLHLATAECARPPLVLIHGFLGYSFSWRHNLDALARNREVYAIDLLGVGFSDRPPRGALSFSLRDIADRMLRWLEMAGLSKIDLLGTSHGGAIAMRMAALDRERQSDRISRLVLVAPANPYSRTGRKRIWFFNTMLGAWVLKATSGFQGGVRSWALGQMYADRKKIQDGTRAGYRAAMQVEGTLDYALAVVKTWREDMEELREALRSIEETPTMLLWGDRDRAVPPSSVARLAKHFRNAKQVEMKGVGHLPYEEAPEGFNREILDFLDAAGEAKAAGE